MNFSFTEPDPLVFVPDHLACLPEQCAHWFINECAYFQARYTGVLWYFGILSLLIFLYSLVKLEGWYRYIGVFVSVSIFAGSIALRLSMNT